MMRKIYLFQRSYDWLANLPLTKQTLNRSEEIESKNHFSFHLGNRKMYVCVTNGSWSRHSGVVRDYTNDTQSEKNIGFELKIIFNLGYHLFSMFFNFTTSSNSLKRNTSLYSGWDTWTGFRPVFLRNDIDPEFVIDCAFWVVCIAFIHSHKNQENPFFLLLLIVNVKR